MERSREITSNNIVFLTFREFEIPWFSLDKRELIERKGKVKTGRTRGKPRGKRKGY